MFGMSVLTTLRVNTDGVMVQQYSRKGDCKVHTVDSNFSSSTAPVALIQGSIAFHNPYGILPAELYLGYCLRAVHGRADPG